MLVYTSISGEYDNPRKDIVNIQSPSIFAEPRLNSKIVKILGHLYVNEETSLWCDGNMFLKKKKEEFEELLKFYDIVVFKHSTRDCLYEEAEVCKQLKLDYSSKIDEQIAFYQKIGIPKNMGLYQCGAIARRHTPEINRLCEQWWSHVTRFSWRDQISFPVVFKDVKIGVLTTTPGFETNHYKLELHKTFKQYDI